MPSTDDQTERRNLPELSERRCGILLHLTSLLGKFGCGDLGPETWRTAALLAGAGQSWWQMLPVGPPGYGNCPYMAASAFAVSTHFLSLERLMEAGLLPPESLADDSAGRTGKVDFAAVEAYQAPRFDTASRNFFFRPRDRDLAAFEEFQAKEAEWLSDYSLYCALKEETGGAAWTVWEPGVRARKPEALERARRQLQDRIRHHAYLQFELDRQWRAFRGRCRELGLGLMGDIPIFVAHESADVWANPEIFQLDETGQPTFVAGVPPDYFSPTGQRWGHPLYRWDKLKEQGYRWWIRRFQRTFEMFDAARIDHFIGFQRYWEIPASCPTAVEGRYVLGPGEEFFCTLLRRLGKAPIIAEDLGLVTPEVIELRRKFDFPGMRVLQFAFSGDPRKNPHLPHLYENPTVVYTGTHDNDTTVGWYDDLERRLRGDSAEARAEHGFLLRYLGSGGREIRSEVQSEVQPEIRSEIHWAMIRLALSSVAQLAMIPMQDLLGLGSEARMNLPSEATGNWEWRMERGALTPAVLERLRILTETFGRTGPGRGIR